MYYVQVISPIFNYKIIKYIVFFLLKYLWVLKSAIYYISKVILVYKLDESEQVRVFVENRYNFDTLYITKIIS